jgi:hypothetical protein
MMYEDDNMESRVTARSAATNNAELSLVDSYYEVQLVVVNKLADELRESMTVHMKYEHGLMSEEEFRAYQLSGKKRR